MAGMTKNEWKLIGIGAVVAAAVIVPVFQLLRMLSGNTAPRIVDYEDGATGEGRPIRRVGNVFNICIMGGMVTTRVNKVFPAAAVQVGKKSETPSSAQSYSPSLSDENWRL